MNKRLFTRILIALGALVFVGSVSAQAYYTHELAERVAARDPASTVVTPSPADSQAIANPWAAMNTDMAHMQAQMEQMFNTALQNPVGMDFIDGQGAAKVSLSEKGNNYVVTASIPGAKKNDISVHLSGRLLTLSSNDDGSSTKLADNGQLRQQEQYRSSFEQAFTLPGPVNASGMQTHFKDGVLTLTIPKANA
jgi:HSP20 family molecular chaperone IbpA